jgi:hypothetical protein
MLNGGYGATPVEQQPRAIGRWANDGIAAANAFMRSRAAARLSYVPLDQSTSDAVAALPSVIGGPGKDFDGVYGISTAMAVPIASSAAWACTPALV